MANLLSQSQISSFTGIFGDHFDTFADHNEIVVFKEPIKNIVFATPNTSPGYPNYNNENLSENQVTYTPVSGVYNAIVRHKKNNKFEFLPETRAVFFDGDIAIKVKQDARDYILQGRTENITINGRKYTISSDEWVQNFLGLKYYYFGLKTAN
jgi:hypothetical protein